MPVPGRTGKKIKVSVDGGGMPRWRRDGKELFFLSSDRDRKLMTVGVSLEGGVLRVGVPKTLFQTRVKKTGLNWPPYDVAPRRPLPHEREDNDDGPIDHAARQLAGPPEK